MTLSVGNTPSYDQEYVDFVNAIKLRPATVEYIEDVYSGTNGTADLDATEIARLNQADLIVMSRQIPDGNLDDGTERGDGNGITTPLILMSNFVARGNVAGTSNWNWINSTTISAASPLTDIAVTSPSHPIFAGLTLSSTNTLVVHTPAQAIAYRNITATMADTNGKVLTTRAGVADSPMIVIWEDTTLPYFQGITGTPAPTPAGKRMLLSMVDDTGGQLTGHIADMSNDARTVMKQAFYFMLPELGTPTVNEAAGWTMFE